VDAAGGGQMNLAIFRVGWTLVRFPSSWKAKDPEAIKVFPLQLQHQSDRRKLERLDERKEQAQANSRTRLNMCSESSSNTMKNNLKTVY
jgi:hypothetical protein